MTTCTAHIRIWGNLRTFALQTVTPVAECPPRGIFL